MWVKNLVEMFKLLLAVSVVFAAVSCGIFFLHLSSDMKQITAATTQTMGQVQSTLKPLAATLESTNIAMQHLDATVMDTRRVVLVAGGTLGLVRETLKKEQASTQATIQSSQALISNSSSLVATANDTLKNLSTTVNNTLAPIPALLDQTTKAVATANQTIAAVQPLLKNATDTMAHVSGTTADVQTEVHKIVYPPPAPWYQKYIISPIKLGLHMLTIPLK